MDRAVNRFGLMCLQAKLGVLADGVPGPLTLQALLRSHGDEMTLKELHEELEAFRRSGEPSYALLLYARQLEREQVIGRVNHICDLVDEMDVLAQEMRGLARGSE